MNDILLKFLAWCARMFHPHTHPPAPASANDQHWFAAFFDGFTWTQGAIIIAALIAATGVTATIATTSGRARRDRLTDMYAEALSGVSQYIEGPYRIRRRTLGNADQRVAITTFLSDVKARIDHSQNMLNLHARPAVAAAYRAYVTAAMREAGRQMHEAWQMPGIKHDADVNLHVAYSTVESARMLAHVRAVMKADLTLRWFRPWTWMAPSRTARAAVSAAKEADAAEKAKKEAEAAAQAAQAASSPSGVFSRVRRTVHRWRAAR